MIPKISDYMAGSSVLVTGVTGFVGLALVEKLIRCVPDLANIYVLIRPKRGKSKEERYQEIMSNKVSTVAFVHTHYKLVLKKQCRY